MYKTSIKKHNLPFYCEKAKLNFIKTFSNSIKTFLSEDINVDELDRKY